MKLPEDAIGISDITDWQECPRRMSYKMKRWTEDGEPPEAASNWTKRYGAAFHDVVEWLEADQITDEVALQRAMRKYRLDPEEIARLKVDLEVYHDRAPTGVRTVMVEKEIRVPLFQRAGRMFYFRGRIDRLYQSLSDPGLFFHRDYKSSAWPRTQKEIDNDKQLWSYNFGLHETFPEIRTLVQTYDQLSYGELHTQKNDAQREEIREWLILAMEEVMDDDEIGPDGLLVPKWNNWCPWCPIMESCAVVPMLSDFALSEIAKLAPETKNGRKSEVNLDPDLFDVYVERLEQVSTAKGVLERYEQTVKRRLLDLPEDERKRYGYERRTKTIDVFSADALRAAHELLGDDFYRIASLSKAALSSALSGEDETKLNLIVGMADKRGGATYAQKRRGGRS